MANVPVFTRFDIDRVAGILRAAASTGVPCQPVRDAFGVGTSAIDAAYAVQTHNLQLRIADGFRVVGRKIGLTSHAVQKQLGVEQPDFGALTSEMAYSDGDVLPWGTVMQPRAEAEVALVLKAEVAMPWPTVADIIRAIDFVLPAIEVVGSRIANWDISIADTVADNASSGAFVLGGSPTRLDALDLRAVAMEMRRGDEVVSNGVGTNCLGHPLTAAVWLARELVTRETPLSAGDIILTGALGPMVNCSVGDRFEATITGLGSVAFAFGEADK